MQPPDSIWPGAMSATPQRHPTRTGPTLWSSTVSKIQQAVDETSLWLWFALAGAAGASVLALGLLLRSNKALSPRLVVGTLFHAAAWAVGVFLMSFSHFKEDLPFLLGISIMSGMGAASFVDMALMLLRQRLGQGSIVDDYPDAPRRAPPKDRKP